MCRARLRKVEWDLRSIHQAAQSFKSDYGRWPKDIEAIMFPPGSRRELICNYNKDPWGREYVYELTADGPVAACLGADGTPGGAGENEDLIFPTAGVASESQ